MDNKKLCKYLNYTSIILLIILLIVLIFDYSNYKTSGTSFPFYITIIERSIQFLIPSIVCFLISFFKKRKIKK